ncbi:hypothetical protein COR50_05870 [Chitinophaga caeni]|uniref:Uncharacterized protein n=1 Tax=Chitinophaga caeni TaxID=2029983 RepID=A0A291QS22_9BACT|nr:hypothetical protein COR50_05870 [Chitinophaga caeni]
MKYLFLYLGLLFCAPCVSAPGKKMVYICNGKYSKKYHLVEKCRGLRNCSTKIEKVSLGEAKDKGRTLCGWED